MTSLAALLGDRRGAAAAEMALVIPLLLGIMFGSVEIGNYFYNEHKLVKSVRDGARFAARQKLLLSVCSGAPPQTVIDDTKLMVRKGTLDSTANDLLPNWAAATATFTMTMSCQTTVGAYTVAGIYTNVAAGAPTVSLNVQLPYRPVLGMPYGFSGKGLALNASQTAAVSGL